MKFIMQTMKNLDFKIEFFISNLIKLEKVSVIISLCTELRLLIQNVIVYFSSNRINDEFNEEQEIIYHCIINKDNNIYKNILDDDCIMDTLRILYRLGLDDHTEDQENEKFDFTFKLKENIVKKMKNIIIFLNKLCIYMKNSN